MMDKNDDAPEDVKRATSVERSINKGLKDDTFEGYPRVEEKKKRWEHCDEAPSKKSKRGKSDGSCCQKQRGRRQKTERFVKVSVVGEPCTFPKLGIVPRHCLTKTDYIEMLATPSRRCPPDCHKKTVLKKLKPVSHRIKELAQPPRQRMLMTLKSGAHILPPALLDNLVKTLENETCLTPEQASTVSRKKKFGKKKWEKSGPRRYRETSKVKKPSLLGTVSGTGSFDKDSVSCQYLMAERFVKSILQWKCPIPKSELSDVSEVIVRRLVDILEYTLPQDEDRKSQQIRFLADLIACWVTGVLSEVAQDQEKKLTERCKRKEDEMKAEEEEDDDDDDDDDDRDRDDDKDADAEWRERERLEEEEEEEEEEVEDEEEDKARDLDTDMEGEREDEADQLQEAIGVDTDDDETEKMDDAEEIAAEIDEEADLTVKGDDVEATEAEAETEAETGAEAEVEAEAEAEPEPEPEPEVEAEAETEMEAEMEAEAEAKTAEAETDTQVDLEVETVEAETEAKTAEAETDTQVDLGVEKVEAETEVVRPEEEPAESEVAAQVGTEMEPEQEGKAEEGTVVEAEIEPTSMEPTAEETEGVRGDEQRPMEDDSKVEVQTVEEEKVAQEKKEPDGAREMEEKVQEAAKVPSDREKTMAMDRTVTKDLEELFKSDLPFLTFGKIIDTVYNMVEDAPENTGDDPITNGIHRVIYEKLSNIVVLENPELLTEELKDIMDVVCGKIANWLRSVLSKSQIAFMERYVPMVESKEIRDWTRWLAQISDAAIDWNTWLRGVIEKIFEMESAQITRGEWQDWTKSVDTGALLWRRFHLQTIHQAHRNVTMMLGRRVVKTGTIGTNSATSERLIHATDLHA